jgi:hypothetical protein
MIIEGSLEVKVPTLLYCACHAKCIFADPLQMCPMPAIVFETANQPPRFANFWPGTESLAPATQNDD